MFALERQSQIKNYIDTLYRATVQQLCTEFNVSPSTIRNDLVALEKLKLIKRTHGGAISINHPKVGLEPTPTLKESINLIEKRNIAREANKLIENGDTVAVLTGTTTMFLAQTLTNKEDLTVVSNDISISLWLEENTKHRILVLGGFVRTGYHYTDNLDKMIDRLNIDIAFFSCNGFCIKGGASIPDLKLAQTQYSLLKRSKEIILLSDSTKFGHVAFAQIIGSDEINMVITDSNLNKNYVDLLEDHDINHIIVPAT